SDGRVVTIELFRQEVSNQWTQVIFDSAIYDVMESVDPNEISGPSAAVAEIYAKYDDEYGLAGEILPDGRMITLAMFMSELAKYIETEEVEAP
ncbi:MAG: hypothetical protein P9M06_05080, partial [Candidatus Saelkia tenebricola]|nr:hypothetical protein [Candidatus Saelkia tenebricola]